MAGEDLPPAVPGIPAEPDSAGAGAPGSDPVYDGSAEAATAPLPAAAESATAEPGPAPGGSRTHRARLAFRAWRRTRPFWGGLLTVLGGGEILYTYKAPFKLVMHFGLYGLAGFIVPMLLVLLGALILFDPEHRTFYALFAVCASLGTWLTSNLGGFFIGMLLGLIGGSLAFGWQIGERPERKRAERKRRERGHRGLRTRTTS